MIRNITRGGKGATALQLAYQKKRRKTQSCSFSLQHHRSPIIFEALLPALRKGKKEINDVLMLQYLLYFSFSEYVTKSAYYKKYSIN